MNCSSFKIEANKSYKDVFGAYVVDGAEFDLECGYDIPFTNVPDVVELPDYLISYQKIGESSKKGRTYCHFYQDDYTFDGQYGIWNSLVFNRKFKKGFNLEKLSNVDGIICPDYSNYYDMPRVMQIYNVYRSRAIGYFFNSRGITAIPNVRWTDETSYIYAFAGLKKNSVVAIGTVGCLRNKIDRKFFLKGLKELILRIEPSTIIIYGTLTKEIIEILEEYQQDFKFFPSEISLAYKEKNNGNEG